MKTAAPPPEGSPRLRRAWEIGLSAGVLGGLLLWLLLLTGAIDIDDFDIDVYRGYGEAIAAGAVPYRDFPVEYPPGAVPLFTLPALVTDSRESYASAFAILVGAIGIVGLALAARLGAVLGGSCRAVAFRVLVAAATIAVLGSVTLTRFDLVPATLTVAALLALAVERSRLGGVMLGAAIAVKLYPAVVVPVAAAFVFRRAGAREATIFSAITAAVVVATYVPFALVAPDGVVQSLEQQLRRPLQMESLGASLLAVGHAIGLVGPPGTPPYYNLLSPSADAVATVTSFVLVAMLAFLWFAHARGPADRRRLARYAAAVVVAFIAFGKVLSPQYLLWLVLIVPLLPGRRGNVAAGLLGGAAVATAVYFPRWWGELHENLDPGIAGVVLLRNLLLVALLAAVIPLRSRASDRPSIAAQGE